MVSFQKEDSCRDSFVSAVSMVPQEHSTVLQPGTNSAICHKLIKNELCCSQLTGFIPFRHLAHTRLGFFSSLFCCTFSSYSPNNPLAAGKARYFSS